MAHSYMWHDSFINVTCLIHICDMPHSCIWHASFIHVIRLIHICDTTHTANSTCFLPWLTQCNNTATTPQHTATHCNTRPSHTLQRHMPLTLPHKLQQHCNSTATALQQHCNSTATHCNTLQHTAIHSPHIRDTSYSHEWILCIYFKLQHTATNVSHICNVAQLIHTCEYSESISIRGMRISF